MTVLAALDGYYHRMAAREGASSPGLSREKISFAVVLDLAGEPVAVLDLRDSTGKKAVPRVMEVPAAVKRTVAILPNLMWDKTAYALGRTAGEGKRTGQEHGAFRDLHLDVLRESDDPGLVALRRFLEGWSPGRFDAAPFRPEMLDANVVFALEGETRFLHEREAASALLAARASGDAPGVTCLVTGAEAPVQRLHPSIKGVEGAQTAGAALVSFNLDSFTSYGKEQGDNAPVSEAAAFRYGTALNRMLERGGGNRLRRPIGDATVVYWADASGAGEDMAQAMEAFFGRELDPPTEDGDAAEAGRLGKALEEVAAGRALAGLEPGVAEGARFHVLGLSPNAARLSVRFWMEDRFAAFARRLADHAGDLALEPSPWRGTRPPSVSLLLARTTAVLGKFENIPPLLAGEVMRAILTGGDYPRALLAAAVIRLRAGDDPATGWHAAVIRAVLARRARRTRTGNEGAAGGPGGAPMSLEPDNPSAAYQLGRLFAAIEAAQRQALPGLNATIRDRYFGAASATPARVFPLLIKGMQNHLSKLRKEGKGGWIEREIEQIMSRLPINWDRSLRLEDQGRFAIGYYHQRSAQFTKRPATETDSTATEETTDE